MVDREFIIGLLSSKNCRQTGKTESTAKQCQYWKDEGVSCIMVCFNDAQARYVKNKYKIPTCTPRNIPIQLPDRVLFDPDTILFELM